MILAQRGQLRWKTHLHHNFFFNSKWKSMCSGDTRLCDIVFASPQPSGSDDQTLDEQEEREILRRVLKQMGRIKCPSEVCTLTMGIFDFIHSILYMSLPVFWYRHMHLYDTVCHVEFSPVLSCQFQFRFSHSSGCAISVCLLLPLFPVSLTPC